MIAEDLGLGEAVLAGALLGVLSAVLDNAMRPPQVPSVFIRQSVIIHQRMIWSETTTPPLPLARGARTASAERRRLRRTRRLAGRQ